MRKLSLHSAGLRIGVIAFLWLLLVTWSHMVLNKECGFRNRVIMGYMPVVSNLAAPLADFATKGDDLHFEALKFSSFSEMGEAFRSGHIQAAFMIAPLALMLFDQGVPLKIVYIGNRHESTMVVRASARYDSASDLIGKTIAVPLRYSGHYLALKRYLREHGLTPSDVRIIEVPPRNARGFGCIGDRRLFCRGTFRKQGPGDRNRETFPGCGIDLAKIHLQRPDCQTGTYPGTSRVGAKAGRDGDNVRSLGSGPH